MGWVFERRVRTPWYEWSQQVRAACSQFVSIRLAERLAAHARMERASDAAFVLDATHQVLEGFGGALIRLLCQFRSGVRAARYSGKARRASAHDGCYPLPSSRLRAILFRNRGFFEGRADCNQLRILVRIARILRLPEGGLTSS